MQDAPAMHRSALAFRALICLFLSVFSLTLSRAADAQVNVEPLRQQVTARKFGARISASTDAYAGNTQGVIFGSSVLAGGRTERNFGYLDLSGDYSKLGGLVSVAKWFAHLRHNFQMSPDTWWEEYAQIESDRFRRVQLRELLGTGPRFAITHGDVFELFFGTSYMVEHTELESGDRDPRGQGTFERWSNYVAVTFKPDARILLSSVNYIQPRIDQFSDYKVLSVSSAAFTITKHLQSHVDATARYESVVPSDVRPTDLELKSSLEVVF